MTAGRFIRQLWLSLWSWNPNRIKIVGRDKVLYREGGKETYLQGEMVFGGEYELEIVLPERIRWTKPKVIDFSRDERARLIERLESGILETDGVRVKLIDRGAALDLANL